MYVLSAASSLAPVVAQFRRPENHIPGWFVRFVNSNVLFTGVPTVAVILLLVGLRVITRGPDDRMSWRDFDFGLQLVFAAIVAIPAAAALRVAKERYEFSGTSPHSTIEISAVILVSLVLLAVVLARAEARKMQPSGATPSLTDLAFGVFVPDLAGIFSVMLVLLFASRGGTLHG